MFQISADKHSNSGEKKEEDMKEEEKEKEMKKMEKEKRGKVRAVKSRRGQTTTKIIKGHHFIQLLKDRKKKRINFGFKSLMVEITQKIGSKTRNF